MPQTRARALGARTPELTASLRLAQLDPGSTQRRAIVQAVYDSFTEGFDTPALRDVREWFTETASAVP